MKKLVLAFCILTCAIVLASCEPAATSIALEHDEVVMGPGCEFNMILQVLPEEASESTKEKTTWTSSDPTVATVEGGKVSALKTGTTTITATTKRGLVSSCTVSVQTSGSAEVVGPTGRTSCEYVQLWYGGPLIARFPVGSTITSYENVTTYSTANAGGLYTSGGTADAKVSYTDDHDFTKDTATLLWGSRWKTLASGCFYPLSGSSFPSPNVCIRSDYDGSSSKYVTGCTLKGVKISGKQGTDYEGFHIFFPLSEYSVYGNQTPQEFCCSLLCNAYRLELRVSGYGIGACSENCAGTIFAVLAY